MFHHSSLTASRIPPAVAVLLVALTVLLLQSGAPARESDKSFTDDFDWRNRKFTSTGANPFFILKPGHQIVLQEDKNPDKGERVIITVLDETRTIEGVETRVVEEREFDDGELVEVSRNFFAICQRTNDVFYFGEEVDDYKDGKVVAHSGAWLAGKDGAKPGIIMPGTFMLGARYYQEIAPGKAMDRAENVKIGLTIDGPAGKLTGCIEVLESSDLERGTSTKRYAPGIGMIYDDGLKLVRHGFANDAQ